MCDSLDRHTKDGTLEHTWKKRFRNKWPTMTTLMHQSEITIQPYLESEYADPHEIMAYQNCKIPEWDGSSETSWSAARSIEHDLHEEDILSNVNQSSMVTKQRRCDKVCRYILCAFLILSIVMAVVAAIGLSFFLNLQQNNGLADQGGHFHGNHIPANISTEEEIYLSKIFCGVVKHLLVKTDFPVENGIESCHTSLLFVENSENLHIEMHVSPKAGYTIKEKILRILSDGVLRESRKSLENKKIQTSTSLNNLQTEQSTLPDKNLPEHVTTFSPTSRVENEHNVADSTNVPDREVVNKTTSNNVLQVISTEMYRSTTSTEVVNDQNIANQANEIIVNQSDFPTSSKEATTLPPIIMPIETIKLDGENTKAFQYETSTSREERTVSLDDLAGIHETLTTTVLPSVGNNFEIQDSVLGYKNLISTEKPKVQIPLVIDPAPVVTKLFNPKPMNFANTFVDGGSNVALTNVKPQSKPNKSTKVVESLMAGGVMKLPFKTNSNFRFLFSSDSKVKPTKRNHLKSQEVVIKENSDNMINTADVNAKARFNSQDIKYSRTEALDLFTEKPKQPKLLRTLRMPISSTKSFMKRKVELQKKPKRAIDVTEFGAQSIVLTA